MLERREYRLPPWLHDAALQVWDRRLLIGSVYLGMVWLAIFATLLFPPTYEVSAVISLKPGPLSGGDAEKFAATTRPEQVARPQIALLESENVIRQAISVVGATNLYPATMTASGSQVDRAGISTFRIFKPLASVDAAYIAAKGSLSVRPEPQTDLIRVNFRHANPKLAVDFTDALVQSFTERYYQLYSNIGAVSFFWEQQKQSDEAFARTSAALSEYSTNNQLFRIDDQRRLLLEQRSALAAALVGTTGLIAEKESQTAAIPSQLAQMKPIARNPQITGLTQLDVPPAPGTAPVAAKKQTSAPIASLAADPPLLLVKVYQDTVAALVKLHTDLAGLRALKAHQEKTLKELDVDLSSLSSKEAEFERLRREVMQARDNSDLFTKKALEEQLSQDLNARKLSSVQVLQGATTPLRPIWPKPGLLLALGILLSAAPAVGAFALHRTFFRTRGA